MCGEDLDGLVVQLGLQLLVLRHLPHRLHEVLINHVLPLRSAIQHIHRVIYKQVQSETCRTVLPPTNKEVMKRSSSS
jgi:hypothetical protein